MLFRYTPGCYEAQKALQKPDTLPDGFIYPFIFKSGLLLYGCMDHLCITGLSLD
jgi:hypothetical protein